MGEDGGGGDARVGAGEAMGEEEWARVSRAACWGTGWVLAFLVSLFSVRFPLFFLCSFLIVGGVGGPL